MRRYSGQAFSVCLPSPLGVLRIHARAGALTSIEMLDDDPDPAPEYARPPLATRRLLSAARKQLNEYFGGKRREFDLPLAPDGTEFQLRVWHALQEIPYGETWSYARLASQIGQPQALRAVGAANGRNPLPIVIPCHRVINADGTLGGFSSGVWRKQKLLALEAPPFSLVAERF